MELCAKSAGRYSRIINPLAIRALVNSANRKGNKMPKNDPLKPSAILLIKLGSIAVHLDEMIETKFQDVAFDLPALQTVFDDEVKDWIKNMGPLLPLKRSTRRK
jgi:hypothetical protein